MKSIQGVIVSGLGEGAYFMSMKHYKNEIKNKLGFDAYPGTLNVKIKQDRHDLLKDIAKIRISGFTKDNKTYGGAGCYMAKIENINGAIIVPDINKNPKNILEFIAPVHVKSTLNLTDGDKITINLT